MEFQYEPAKNRLINLDLLNQNHPKLAFTTPGEDIVGGGQDQSGTNKQAKLIQLGGYIDLESRKSVRTCFPLT